MILVLFFKLTLVSVLIHRLILMLDIDIGGEFVVCIRVCTHIDIDVDIDIGVGLGVDLDV